MIWARNPSVGIPELRRVDGTPVTPMSLFQSLLTWSTGPRPGARMPVDRPNRRGCHALPRRRIGRGTARRCVVTGVGSCEARLDGRRHLDRQCRAPTIGRPRAGRTHPARTGGESRCSVSRGLDEESDVKTMLGHVHSPVQRKRLEDALDAVHQIMIDAVLIYRALDDQSCRDDQG